VRARAHRSAGAGERRAQRLGVFGGTFDPIHVAHLRCAEEAREAMALDRVLFVPSASPPHKGGRAVAPARDRLEMVRRAVARNPGFAVSSIELERPGRSYTVDTLRELRQRLPDTRLVLLVGLDAFREIGTWKDYGSLFSLADVAVLARPGRRSSNLRALLPFAARANFCYSARRDRLEHRSGNQVIFLDVTALDISATAIRQRAAQGRSIRYLVPPSVERYLSERRLYARGSGTS
jgi:nicotinate-nucleotide adenylyltransferase